MPSQTFGQHCQKVPARRRHWGQGISPASDVLTSKRDACTTAALWRRWPLAPPLAGLFQSSKVIGVGGQSPLPLKDYWHMESRVFLTWDSTFSSPSSSCQTQEAVHNSVPLETNICAAHPKKKPNEYHCTHQASWSSYSGRHSGQLGVMYDSLSRLFTQHLLNFIRRGCPC